MSNQIGKRRTLQDFGHRITDFPPQPFEAARPFMGANFMSRDTDAIDRSQRSVHHSDDFGDTDLGGRPGEIITAVRPFAAAEIPCPLELEEDLFEEPLRDRLRLRNIPDVEELFIVVPGKLEHCPAGIFSLSRKAQRSSF
jgi:hypothetical protein